MKNHSVIPKQTKKVSRVKLQRGRKEESIVCVCMCVFYRNKKGGTKGHCCVRAVKIGKAVFPPRQSTHHCQHLIISSSLDFDRTKRHSILNDRSWREKTLKIY